MTEPLLGPKDTLDLMTNRLSSATLDLFAAFGIRVAPALPCGAFAGPHATATIPFSGEGLSGALMLVAPVPAINAWSQAYAGVDPESDEELRDTIAEFTNMLLGRLRTQLLQSGLTLHMATPSTTADAQLFLVEADGAGRKWLSFTSAAGPIAARLDGAFLPDFALLLQSCVTMVEGETVLFLDSVEVERCMT